MRFDSVKAVLFMRVRKESDVLGVVEVPEGAYYGSETQRAFKNFNGVSGAHLQASIIHNYALLKEAAALANMKAGKLDGKRGRAIVKACAEISEGKFDDQFIVDAFQAGAGTSTNMNVNEVAANRAIEILGGERGDYKIVHPNDHVNMSQSTNDTFHCNTHLTAYRAVHESLMPSLEGLEAALKSKSREFSDIVKVGRTHLQDAVPMTLGQEFSGYAGSVSNAIHDLDEASSSLLELPLGGTALGTGINTPKNYAAYAVQELSRLTGIKFRRAPNTFASMQNQRAELRVAEALRETATTLGKIANDFRLLSSGPRTGIAELVLPSVQPGSSIMPGKINPSMAEMLNMACFHVMGNCHAVEHAAAAGQLELNVFMPVIAYNLVGAIGLLSNATSAFTERCVTGVAANTDMIGKHLSMNISIATSLTPYIGYSKAAEIAMRAYKENKSVREICMELRVLPDKELDRILDPSAQV